MSHSWKRIVLLATVVALIAIIISPMQVLAKPDYLKQIPAGYKKSCSLCHAKTDPPVLNGFGKSWVASGKKFKPLATAKAPVKKVVKPAVKPKPVAKPAVKTKPVAKPTPKPVAKPVAKPAAKPAPKPAPAPAPQSGDAPGYGN